LFVLVSFYFFLGLFLVSSPLLGGGGLENLDRYARRFLDFMRPVAAGAR
jgi:hypothetical protein